MATYYVKTTGSDTTGDGSSGNPYATPGKALGVAVAGAAGWTIYVEAGTYNITSSTANIAAGVLNFNQTGTLAVPNRMIGYTSTPGDGGKFTLALGAGLAVTVVTMNNANSYNEIWNVAITGNSTSGASALNAQGRSNLMSNFEISAFTGGGNHICSATNNFLLEYGRISGGATSNYAALSLGGQGVSVRGVDLSGNAGRGIDMGSTSGGIIALTNCIVRGLTTAEGKAFQNQTSMLMLCVNCIAYNCAADHYRTASTSSSMRLINCVSDMSGGYDFNPNATYDGSMILDNCCYGTSARASTSGIYPASHAPARMANCATFTADPWANAAGGDFTPNSTSGAGAVLRAAGIGPYGQTSYVDIGAVQHQDSGGGGGYAPVGPSFIRGIS